VLDFFFPSPCLLCGKNGKPICTNCLLRLQLQLGRTESKGLEIFYLSIYQDEIAKVITAIKDKGLTSLIIPAVRLGAWIRLALARKSAWIIWLAHLNAEQAALQPAALF